MIITEEIEDYNAYIELGSYPHLPIPDNCPTCAAEKKHIKRIGYYTRWICVEKGNRKLQVGRVFCKKCKTSHALLPAFVIPRRLEETTIIEKFLTNRVLKNLSLKKSMLDSGAFINARQKGSWWILGLLKNISKLQHYVNSFINRFNSKQSTSKDKRIRLLHPFVFLLFLSEQTPSKKLSFHNARFHQLTGISII